MGRKKLQQEERWISAKEATKMLSEKAGRPITRSYISSLVRLGRVDVRPVDGRTNEYRASDLENYIVRPRKKNSVEEDAALAPG